MVCLVFASTIIRITGGESFMEAVPVFRVLMLSLVPIGLSNIAGGLVLIPAGKEMKLLYAEIAGAVLCLASCLVFIPKYSTIAAGSAAVASEILVCILCFWYSKKDLGVDLVKESASFIAEKIKRGAELSAIFLANLGGRGKRLPYYCPCCNRHLYHFRDGGFASVPEVYDTERYRVTDQAVVCPVCQSLPRHRIMISWLNEHMGLLKDKRILIFAPEKSVCNWLDRNNVTYTTADLYRPSDIKIDIQDTGLEDGSYDIIICNHVLEHVDNYSKALEELKRIISPEGFIIMSFPVDNSLDKVHEDSTVTTPEGRIREFGQYDHLRVFGNDSKAMLQSFGFEVNQIDGSAFDSRIKPVIGPADYDSNILWILSLTKRIFS